MDKNKKAYDFPINIGNLVTPITLLFLFHFLWSLSNPSVMEVSWPYIVMIGGTLIIVLLTRIKASQRIISLSLVSLMILLFGIQFLFYFVLPDYYDYQPVTIPGMQMIYQLHGKIQVFYSPDYPTQGDTIRGYVSICSNDYSICEDLEKYYLTASFRDESGNRHTLLDNKQFTNKTYFEMEYMGHLIDVEVGYQNLTYRFIMPKQSLYQTIWEQFNRHPWYGFAFIIGVILSTVSLLIILFNKSFRKKIKTVYVEEINRIMKFFKPKSNKKGDGGKEKKKTTDSDASPPSQRDNQ